jgi:HEAT repeat protein
MIGLRSLILAMVLVLAYERPLHAQTLVPPSQAAATSTPAPAAEVDQELALIKDQLYNNKDASMRVSAATVLLFKDGPAAREMILETLRQVENPAAKVAVCRALDRTRTDPRPLKNKDDFLQPLISILGMEEDTSVAQPAAEATLMFSYDQVQAGLERIAGESQLPVTIRSNAIYALQLHPDKRAVLALIGLLDDPDGTVALAATDALSSLGISLPEDAQARRQAIGDLEQQKPEAYLRKRLVRSEADIRALRSAVLSWQDYYFAALDDWYGSLSDETAKSTFLADRLKKAEPEIRLWALGRLEELRKGTGKLKYSEDLEKTLLSLVSSRNRQVRLKTARLLARMGEMNCAPKLLQQLKVEDDAEVRQELFVALGGACYYASLDTSPFKVSDEVRHETLEWAVRFLNEQRVERVRSGADVIRKLLTQNGLKPEDVDKYLQALSQRYQQAMGEAGGVPRGELLSAMAGLCTAQSVCRLQAAKLYGPLFEQALSDGAESVRQAAVEGLINLDSAAALKKLRKDMADDPSAAIRAKLIDVAGEVGAAEDLDWLSKKIGLPGEGGPAWQAMLKIFGRSGMDVLVAWATAFTSAPLQEKLSSEQAISYFVLLEQRAQSESKTDVLTEARRRLADLYTLGGDFKQATDYLKLLEDTAASPQEKEGLLSDRLSICLRWPNLDMASQIVDSYLQGSDLTMDSPLAKSIDGYLKAPPAGADPNLLLEKLVKIKGKETESRPGWRDLLVQWSKPVARAPKSAETEQISN